MAEAFPVRIVEDGFPVSIPPIDYSAPLLRNGAYTSGKDFHILATNSTFIPSTRIRTSVEVPNPSNLPVLETDSKRRQDNQLSLLRDYIEIIVAPGQYAKTSFAWDWKGDFSLVKPVVQIDFRTAHAGISVQSSSDVLGTDIGGGWYKFNLTNITIPATATRIRYNVRLEARAGNVSEVVSRSWHTGMVATFGTTTPTYQHFATDDISNSILNDSTFTLNLIPKVNNFWNLSDRFVTFYGDSIIAANVSISGTILTDTEVDRLVKKFNIVPYVRGVGGTRVVDNGSFAWFDSVGLYKGRPDDPNGNTTQPANTTQLGSAMCNLERISTIPTDTQYIFIRGGTNDYLNYPVGDVNSPKLGLSTDVGITFSGAYMLMLDRIYARIPNAVVILATPTHRDNEDTDVGAGGLRFEQIRQAIRNIAAKYKYILHETSRCGINQLNHGTYLTDGIHPNTLGYGKMYNAEAETFKNLIP